jgi:hypothetical protein
VKSVFSQPETVNCFLLQAICCGESLQDSSPTRSGESAALSTNHSRRRAARRRVPSDPWAQGEQTPRLAW